VKDGDGIVRMLSLMGASRAVMEFENVRVVREVSGQVNRRLNFETANIDKTISSAMRQVAAIEELERSGRIEELSTALREVARARRGNPELNLAELAAGMQLSKSAVNHRLRRLVEIVEGAAESEGEHVAPNGKNGKVQGVQDGQNGQDGQRSLTATIRADEPGEAPRAAPAFGGRVA
jgi:DNA-binding transcriptional regulator WhiA